MVKKIVPQLTNIPDYRFDNQPDEAFEMCERRQLEVRPAAVAGPFDTASAGRFRARDNVEIQPIGEGGIQENNHSPRLFPDEDEVQPPGEGGIHLSRD